MVPSLTVRAGNPSTTFWSRTGTASPLSSTRSTTAAWKLKPSWYLVAKDDKTINPDLERMYAERAHSHKVEVAGASHAVYVSHPKEVAALIEEAAQHAIP